MKNLAGNTGSSETLNVYLLWMVWCSSVDFRWLTAGEVGERLAQRHAFGLLCRRPGFDSREGVWVGVSTPDSGVARISSRGVPVLRGAPDPGGPSSERGPSSTNGPNQSVYNKTRLHNLCIFRCYRKSAAEPGIFF